MVPASLLLLVTSAQFYIVSVLGAACITANTVGSLQGNRSHDLELWQNHGEVKGLYLFTTEASDFEGLQLLYGDQDGPVRGNSLGTIPHIVNLPAGYQITGVFGRFDDSIGDLGFTITDSGDQIYRLSTAGGFSYDERMFEMSAPTGGRLVAVGSSEEMASGKKLLTSFTVYWSVCETDTSAPAAPPAWPSGLQTTELFVGGLEGSPFSESQYHQDHGRISRVIMYTSPAGELTGFQFEYGNITAPVNGNATQTTASLSIPEDFRLVGVFGVCGVTHVTALGMVVKLPAGDLSYIGTGDSTTTTDPVLFKYIAPPGKELAYVSGLLGDDSGSSRVLAVDFAWQDYTSDTSVPPPTPPPHGAVAAPPPSPSVLPTPLPSRSPPATGSGGIVQQSSSASDSSKAWIAGPVAGGVAGAVILVAAIVFLAGRRQRRAATAVPQHAAYAMS